jgi:hypothetical protein
MKLLEWVMSFVAVKPFGALKVLTLKEMPKWEEWASFGDKNGGGAFPQIEKLYIWDCPKLTRGLPVHLSSLSKLEIINVRNWWLHSY